MLTSINEFKIILENLQQADKLYFNNNKLSEKDKEIILSITNGDNFTKQFCDIYYYVTKNNYYYDGLKDLKIFYNTISNYKKNIFPIKNYNEFVTNGIVTNNLIYSLKLRYKLLEEYNQLPSLGKRNFPEDISREYDIKDMTELINKLNYFNGILPLINNKPENIKKKIYNKIFRSNYTLGQWINFLDKKENLISDGSLTKDDFIKVIQNQDLDILTVYNKNNYMIVRVDNIDDMEQLGCNSLWCFTYGESNWRTWSENSTNDIVYVIFNFNLTPNDLNFMRVLIKPLEYDIDEDEQEEDVNNGKLFDLGNDYIDNPVYKLSDFLSIEEMKDIFTFEYD